MTQGRPKITSFENFVWIDITKPSQDLLEQMATTHQLDLFQVRDSLEQGHLPKFEKLSNYNFVILRAFTSNIKAGATTINELSNKIAFFYNSSTVITIHRKPFTFISQLDPRKSFKSSDDLLLYLIHSMYQSYEKPLDDLDVEIEKIEKTVFLKSYVKISLEDLYFLKSQTRITKKLLQISQSVIGNIEVGEESKSALQDIKDQLLSLILSYEEILEDANNLLNTYLSVNAQKSNDVMKLLTIFSAFFLPLTFIAGIYGMNFDNMPELRHPLGYFATLGGMVVMSGVIYFWFKRKKIL